MTEHQYVCLTQQQFVCDDYALVPIRQQDMESIRQWRNAQMEVLRQNTPITEAQQQTYYQRVITPLFTQQQPSQVLFSYLYHGECIGYGGLTNVVWPHRRAEVSFLLETARTISIPSYQHEWAVFLKLLKQLAFDTLKLHRLYTETFASRTHHIETLEAAGFLLEGTMRHHVWMNGKAVDALIHGCLNQ